MATLGPPDLNQLLAQLLQQQQERRFSYLGQQQTGPQKFGAALGMILGDAFRGSPEEQIKKGATYQTAQQKAELFKGVDPNDPQSLLSAAEQVQETNPDLAWQFRQAAVQAEALALEKRRLTADVTTSEVGARVAKETEDEQVALAGEQLEGARASTAAAKLGLQYDEATIGDRIARAGLENQVLRAQVSNYLSGGASSTQLSKLLQEQQSIIQQRNQYDQGTREYDALDRQVKLYEQKIQNYTNNVTTTIDGTKLTEANVTAVQRRVQQFTQMRGLIDQLTTQLRKPGAGTGITADLRRKIAGVGGSIISEISPASAERFSEAVASQEQIQIRTLAELVANEYAKVLHAGGDRFTQTAVDRSEELLQTIRTTTDDRTALEALTTLQGFLEQAASEDILRLRTLEVLPGQQPRLLTEDPEITGGN